MSKIEELYLELKNQIWEKDYGVVDHHWTQMVLNLDLIMNEFNKQKKILDILKEMLTNSDTLTGWYEIFIDTGYTEDEKHENEMKTLKEWLNNDK